MNIFNSLSNFNKNKSYVAALGNFDGVHKGHRELFNIVCECAKKRGISSLAVTFDVHPANYLSGHCISPYITNNDEKARLIGEIGIDNIMFLPFNKELSSYTPERFVKEILKDALNIKVAVCGFHYSFGYAGTGTANDLRELCAKHDIDVLVIPPVLSDDVIVSSSYIRTLILSGDMELAAHFLGRPFSFSGKVITGKQIGRKMGIPTINQDFEEGSIVPSYGVYATRINIDGVFLPCVTNIGVRPTISENAKENMETHIINKSLNLYDSRIRVEFLKKIRGEQKFPNLTALKNQINLDMKKSVEIFEDFS